MLAQHVQNLAAKHDRSDRYEDPDRERDDDVPHRLAGPVGNSSQIIWPIMLSNLGSSTLATSTSPVTVERAPCQRQKAAITCTVLPGSAAGTSSGWRHIWFGSTASC